MPQTDQISIVTQKIVDLLKSNWRTIGVPTEGDIYYGDEERYPRYPSVAVEAIEHAAPLYQTGLQVANSFTVSIMVFHSRIGDAETTRKERDERAEAVRDVLHTDKKLVVDDADGAVVFGHVELIEPGVSVRGQDRLFATRLTWSGQSRTVIS